MPSCPGCKDQPPPDPCLPPPLPPRNDQCAVFAYRERLREVTRAKSAANAGRRFA